MSVTMKRKAILESYGISVEASYGRHLSQYTVSGNDGWLL